MAASLGMLRDESDAVEEQRVVAYPSSDLFTCRFLPTKWGTGAQSVA
jgi:hypothetical protein